VGGCCLDTGLATQVVQSELPKSMISYSPGEMLIPLPWSGTPSQCNFEEVSWLKSLPDTTWLALWQRHTDTNLPDHHDSYVISFHLEAVDVDWLDQQCTLIDKPIVVLFDGSYYNWPHRDNLFPMCYIYWHRQCEKIKKWHGEQHVVDEKKYLASAVCNRITQSKLLIFTALSEFLGPDRTRLILSTWLEEKNVHYRRPTGNPVLDDLSDIFWSKYYGKEFRQDNFDSGMNFQAYTSNHREPFLTESALNFTNESYHYSLMGDHIRPGPFITEKTLKCLVGGHAFVPVGQFDTYGSLSKLGLKFDYQFDISWDNDPGNITRLEKIIALIKSFKSMTPMDLLDATKASSLHNLDHINSGNFTKICKNYNENTINQVLDLLT
jgi:hypothetical protein